MRVADMFAGQCTSANGTYNCQRAKHTEGRHSHNFNSVGEHRVALWESAYGLVKFYTIKG